MFCIHFDIYRKKKMTSEEGNTMPSLSDILLQCGHAGMHLGGRRSYQTACSRCRQQDWVSVMVVAFTDLMKNGALCCAALFAPVKWCFCIRFLPYAEYWI